MLKHSEPSQSCSVPSSWFSIFLAPVEKEGIEAIFVPKRFVHLYRQKDPGKATTFYFWVYSGVHFSTKEHWSPYPRALTTNLDKCQDELCKDTNFPQFNIVFHPPCVYTFEMQVRAKESMQKEIIWAFSVRALYCFSAVLVYLQK